MVCPDANTLQALIGGGLTPERREAVFRHTDGCTDCQSVLAALAREKAPARDAAHEPAMPEARADERVGRPLRQGSRVGRYQVESFVGAGGLGLVYVAHDPELHRRVALKLLKSEQRLLTREAQALARVSHPNVVAVYDVGEWNGRLFFAMEMVDGMDLRAWLRERPRRSAEIVDVLGAAGRGLAAAHGVGLVHCDFKPENVLIGRDGRVRVTDFGLARAIEGPPAREPAVSGTPAYMAPEQHRGEHVDGRTDQFAFCVALYEALYGERPFAGQDYDEVRDAVVAGRLRTPKAGARVPPTLRRIVERGLAVRPGDRWPTMETLLHALGRDRTKVPRRIGAVALALLAVLATAWAGDRIVRARLHAVARTSFAAARGQVERTLALRYESFSALAQVSALVPIVRQVAAARDQSDFGLGRAAEDASRLEALHASLRDADWQAWALVTRRGHVAFADYKGRLLYTTANPAVFGQDVRQVPAVAAAYGLDAPRASAQVLRADDPMLVGSGLAGPGRGLVIVFAHASVLAGVPQAVFIQAIDGGRLLEELRIDGHTRLALLAPDGSAQGDVPAGLYAKARAAGESLREVSDAGRPWLVQSHPVPNLGGGPPVAMLVLARPADVGLAGLFPHARGLLLGLGAACLLVLLWSLKAMKSQVLTSG